MSISVQRSNSDVHVLPEGDLREHACTRTCWCQPAIETHDPETGRGYVGMAAMVVHNSADGRELVEEHGLQ